MTVSELIKELEKYDPDCEVRMAFAGIDGYYGSADIRKVYDARYGIIYIEKDKVVPKLMLMICKAQ